MMHYIRILNLLSHIIYKHLFEDNHRENEDILCHFSHMLSYLLAEVSGANLTVGASCSTLNSRGTSRGERGIEQDI